MCLLLARSFFWDLYLEALHSLEVAFTLLAPSEYLVWILYLLESLVPCGRPRPAQVVTLGQIAVIYSLVIAII